MDKMNIVADMAKVSVKGGFHVMWGLVASTLISALGTILIAWLLGEYNYGLYSIVLTAPNLIILFRDWGVSQAMVRYTAKSNAENRTTNIKSIFKAGLLFEFLSGMALSLIGFLISDFLASTALNRPTIAPLIQVASFMVLASALVSTATAAFTGVERMHLNSFMLVGQSLLKTTIVITLVFLGLGTYGAVLGYTIASIVTGIIGLLLLYSLYKRLPNPEGNAPQIRSNINTMLKYGLPLSLAGIIAGFMVQYFKFILYIYVPDNAIIGNYAIAQNFVVLINFFVSPVTTMLFPAFSKLNYRRDQIALKNVFQASVKYASLLVVPFAAMIMVVAQPAISTLFGNSYSEAPLFLALIAINYFYPILGTLSTGSLINGQGQTTFIFMIAIINAAIGFPMGFILISSYGVLGLIVTTLTAGIPGLITSLILIKKRYNITIHWESSAKILLSSITAAAFTYVILAQIGTFASLSRLLIGVAIFAPTYLIAALLTKAFGRLEVRNLREMFSTLGPLSRLLIVLLDIIEKLIGILRIE